MLAFLGFRNLVLGLVGRGESLLIGQRIARLALAAVMALTVLLPQSTVTASAASGDRTLYLYYTHTKETGTFTFRRNGQYDQKVLRELNQFLRDWRRNEPANMDPALFDLLWGIYNEVGATQPIHIVSAYRSPATNEALRKKSSGVAENSQHTKGKAMDFFIPGISLATLRATAMRHQVGGVGYYPTSGSPFVHLDTGNVRAWPRMTRAQLKKVFPDGKTLHLPTDGTPLSEDGRKYAEAQWQQCRTVPCNGARTMLASADEQAPTPAGPRTTLMDLFFGGDSAAEDGLMAEVADPGPTQREVETFAVINAPVPLLRPASLGGPDVAVAALDAADSMPFSSTGSLPLDAADLAGDPNAPYPLQKSQAVMLATRDPLVSDGQTAILAIASLDAPLPAARTLMTPIDDLVTAYAATGFESDPGAQRALEMIIERETTASLPAEVATPQPQAEQPLLAASALRTASLGDTVGIDALSDLFDATFSAVANAGVKQPVVEAVTDLAAAHPLQGVETRSVQFVMPDMDHVELFAQQFSIESAGYAVMFEHDEADFSPATELGGYVTRIGFELDPTASFSANRFDTEAPLLIAAR